MINFGRPIFHTKYEAYTISLFSWGSERLFFAQFSDENENSIGMTPTFYEFG